MKKYKLAIVGATGVVGRSALQVLEEMKLPISEYKLFASKNSASKKIKFLGSEYTVYELDEHSFDEGFDFAIFSEVVIFLKSMPLLLFQKIALL